MVGAGRDVGLTDGPLRQLADARAALVPVKAALRRGSASGATSPSESVRTAFRRAVALAADLPALVRWWRSVPRLDLALGAGPAGADIARELALVRWRRTLLAVAEPAADARSYLVGRSRQAVRTNRAHAQAHGYRAAEARDQTIVRECLDRLARHGLPRYHVDGTRWRCETGLGRFWVVRDAGGLGCALASVSVDGAVARVNGAHVLAAEHASAVRYLLASQIFLDLVEEGVRFVVTDRAVASSAGVAYLQARLGYRPRRVRIVAAAPVDRRGRIQPVASVLRQTRT